MALSSKVRSAVLERDGFTCRYCGQRPESLREYRYGNLVASLHVDHVWPKSKGGSDYLSNLVTACVACNLSKAAKLWMPLGLTCISCGDPPNMSKNGSQGVTLDRWGASYECLNCSWSRQQEEWRQTDFESETGEWSDLAQEQRYWDWVERQEFAEAA